MGKLLEVYDTHCSVCDRHTFLFLIIGCPGQLTRTLTNFGALEVMIGQKISGPKSSLARGIELEAFGGSKPQSPKSRPLSQPKTL